jgi:hypothetical protein
MFHGLFTMIMCASWYSTGTAGRGGGGVGSMTSVEVAVAVDSMWCCVCLKAIGLKAVLGSALIACIAVCARAASRDRGG